MCVHIFWFNNWSLSKSLEFFRGVWSRKSEQKAIYVYATVIQVERGAAGRSSSWG
jgi:hypothetical protein